MRQDEIRAYCLGKHAAVETYPFGPVPICYKLNGRIFAQLYPYAEDYKITLKCTAETGQIYRLMYPDRIRRGYHCPPVQQPYWNTIDLAGFPDDELMRLIDHAYDTVLSGLRREVRKQILEKKEY